MIRGNFQLTMDAKGRLAIPKSYRDSLVAESGLKVVITPHEYEPCLAVYPLPEWLRIEEELRQHPGLSPEADGEARVKAEWRCRLVIGQATDCDIDSHGRLLIPLPLRGHADLKKQVRMVIHAKEKFELWNESTWIARSAEVATWMKDSVPLLRDNRTSQSMPS